jgi:glycosyltransferase involved in cell wall biosynthesis
MTYFTPSDVELHIIGGIQGSGKALTSYKNLFTYHNPLSQNELFNTYSDYDALVLPTIFEGFGLVIIEALAAGLPVITTTHSVGAELIVEGVNGFLVPVRDVNALVDAISKLLNTSEADYQQFRLNARKSAEKFSWENYQKNLKSVIQKMF